jgi:hypothetical protein
MSAVRASKRGTTFRELGLRGEKPVYQRVFNLRVPEGLATIHAVEIPRCHDASGSDLVLMLNLRSTLEDGCTRNA